MKKGLKMENDGRFGKNMKEQENTQMQNREQLELVLTGAKLSAVALSVTNYQLRP